MHSSRNDLAAGLNYQNDELLMAESADHNAMAGDARPHEIKVKLDEIGYKFNNIQRSLDDYELINRGALAELDA